MKNISETDSMRRSTAIRSGCGRRAGSASIMKSFSTKRRCGLSSGLSSTAEMRVKKPRLGRKIDMVPRLRGAFSFVPHDREAADAIQIDRIEFIASPSFDIRIGF